ncbi:MAG: hypothetical protein IPM88_14215 [Nitrospira sp.]|nr:hypothetical protein [Nitrospira sp.]
MGRSGNRCPSHHPRRLTGVSRRIDLTERVVCKACGGSAIMRGRPCIVCGGAGTQAEKRTIEVRIPAGVQNETRVRLAGKGQPGINGGKPGTSICASISRPTASFGKGFDIQVTLPVWPMGGGAGR